MTNFASITSKENVMKTAKEVLSEIDQISTELEVSSQAWYSDAVPEQFEDYDQASLDELLFVDTTDSEMHAYFKVGR
jgi:hypothetical protein